MIKIIFPNNIEFTGVRYGITFTKGVGETNKKFTAEHLAEKGFIIEKDSTPKTNTDNKPKNNKPKK